MSKVPSWLKEYVQEVERWNASINLVSRQGTSARVDLLVGQCLDAVEALLAAPAPLGFDPGEECAYLDLGSGAGLPGFVWHESLVRRGVRVASWLVEPRDKRAWFLDRMARRSTPEVLVLQGLWGEMAPQEPLSAPRILLSLKALHLDDTVVLDGLAHCGIAGSADVTIARFYPHDQAWDSALVEKLVVLPVGETRSTPAGTATALAAGVLPPVDGDSTSASLVVSRYRMDLD